MASDMTTFFWGFASLFGALGYFLWRLEKHVTDAQARLHDLEAMHAADHAHVTTTSEDDQP